MNATEDDPQLPNIAGYYATRYNDAFEKAKATLAEKTIDDADQAHAYIRDALAGGRLTVTVEHCRAAIIGAIWLGTHLHAAAHEIEGDASPDWVHRLITFGVDAAAASFLAAHVVEATKPNDKSNEFIDGTATMRAWLAGNAVNATHLCAELAHWHNHFSERAA